MENKMVIFKYELQSGNGDLEVLRYINQYKITIYTDPDDDTNQECIGEALISHVLFESMLQLNRTKAIECIIDTVPQHVYDVLNVVFNFSQHRIRDRFSQLSPTSNVLVIEKIIIDKNFRKQNIGRKLIIDIAVRFGINSALIALKCFPIQFESSFLGQENDPYQVREFNTDLKKSTHKLLSYYQQMGFSLVRKTDNILALEAHLQKSDILKGLNEMQII